MVLGLIVTSAIPPTALRPQNKCCLQISLSHGVHGEKAEMTEFRSDTGDRVNSHDKGAACRYQYEGAAKSVHFGWSTMMGLYV